MKFLDSQVKIIILCSVSQSNLKYVEIIFTLSQLPN